MPRPKPKVIIEKTDTKTHKIDQILEADAIYAVYYEGKPINIRTISTFVKWPPAKYKKCSFSSSGHAYNLADKLNEEFGTDKFTVHRLVAGEQITEKK